MLLEPVVDSSKPPRQPQPLPNSYSFHPKGGFYLKSTSEETTGPNDSTGAGATAVTEDVTRQGIKGSGRCGSQMTTMWLCVTALWCYAWPCRCYCSSNTTSHMMVLQRPCADEERSQREGRHQRDLPQWEWVREGDISQSHHRRSIGQRMIHLPSFCPLMHAGASQRLCVARSLVWPVLSRQHLVLPAIVAWSRRGLGPVQIDGILPEKQQDQGWECNYSYIRCALCMLYDNKTLHY